jgi:hypothetical protein
MRCRSFLASVCKATNKHTYMVDNLVKGRGWKALRSTSNVHRVQNAMCRLFNISETMARSVIQNKVSASKSALRKKVQRNTPSKKKSKKKKKSKSRKKKRRRSPSPSSSSHSETESESESSSSSSSSSSETASSGQEVADVPVGKKRKRKESKKKKRS